MSELTNEDLKLDIYNYIRFLKKDALNASGKNTLLLMLVDYYIRQENKNE